MKNPAEQAVEALKSYQKKHGLKNSQLCKEVVPDVPVQTALSWLKSKDASLPTGDNLGKLLNGLNRVLCNTSDASNSQESNLAIHIPIISFNGNICYNDETTEKISQTISIDKRLFLSNGIDHDECVAIRISDTNMIPELHLGDFVVVNKIDKIIKDNKIYALNIHNELVIKRLFKVNNGVRIASDNVPKATFDICFDNLEQLEIFGRVTAVIRMI